MGKQVQNIMGEVILVASGKGGVGKTTFTANLGATLALHGARVVLMDLNMGLRNLDIYLGLENEVLFDVADVISGVCSVRKALIRDHRFPELYLLSAAQYKEVIGITPAHMEALFNKLKENFDFILVDGPVGVGENLKLSASGVDRAIVVVTPDYSALRNGDMVDRKLQEMGVASRCHLINMVKPELFGRKVVPDLGEVANMFRTSLAGIVQYDENVNIANNCGYPVVCKRDTYIARNFDVIGKRLFG
ncbi:MAG: septum site-determining protein MinD [Bacillota bacterium]|jgi:septum site-determining protein MinD|nr:septum site-determining protein MinD [Eubacteriales bacterium]MDI9492668.1 septum site-determining protein MinD [Bacillota bacterium]NLV69653.1 septum site-determining protein MinD [Clostridiales bacterium]MDD3537478.1 septum site-determining protein MinD [Eubacteriales bacterium]MDD4286341.1 septum site-determining protein MinD [Eubacteriales bacterium]